MGGVADSPRGRRPSEFSVERIELDSELILILDGELDLTGVKSFSNAVGEITSGTSMTVDLRRLSFMDSSGLQMLMNLHLRAQSEGWSLTLANPRAQVLRVLRLSTLDKRMPIVGGQPFDSPS